MINSWILDSGGAGRGAWQGGVIYELMQWCRKNGCFPSISMGASAGGYAAADVATGTEHTVMKGWTHWGNHDLQRYQLEPPSYYCFGRLGRFRAHLHASIHYVMQENELSRVFQDDPEKKLLIFTTRIRRQDLKPFRSGDMLRFFFKSATRKLPQGLKYLPGGYIEEPVIFATNLPAELRSEYVRHLSRNNYHAVIEASCLVPVAMGSPLFPKDVEVDPLHHSDCQYSGDRGAVFMDGGYSLKMPMRIFHEDPRFQSLADWCSADKTLVICCDPAGTLWETSTRLRRLNSHPRVIRAMQENRMLIIRPDHKVEAGFLCVNNAEVMQTFWRGQEQARQWLQSDQAQHFFEL